MSRPRPWRQKRGRLKETLTKLKEEMVKLAALEAQMLAARPISRCPSPIPLPTPLGSGKEFRLSLPRDWRRHDRREQGRHRSSRLQRREDIAPDLYRDPARCGRS